MTGLSTGRGWRAIAPAILLGSLVLAAGCGNGDSDDGDSGASRSELPQGSEPVELDPTEFSTRIDNPYWPMSPGSRWVYRESDGDTTQRVVVSVTEETKRIANGVVARVVHDVVSEDGEPVEVTDDWYAQDAEGNVWYLGEDTTEYENGKPVSKEGSFEAGVDGAQAGIIMPARPEPGLEYRQEYLAGEAEDRAEVLALGEAVAVPFGKFTETVKTEDTNPLEDPPDVEHKLFAKGVGPVQAIGVSGAAKGSREELLSYARGAG